MRILNENEIVFDPIESERFNNALVHFTQAISLITADPIKLHEDGLALKQSKQYDKAVKVFTECITLAHILKDIYYGIKYSLKLLVGNYNNDTLKADTKFESYKKLEQELKNLKEITLQEKNCDLECDLIAKEYIEHLMGTVSDSESISE